MQKTYSIRVSITHMDSRLIAMDTNHADTNVDTIEDKNTKIRCTNCKCWRDPDSYIGKKGNVVKRCLKCREKDAKQKQKPNVVEKRNERAKEKQYYKTHREKKRAEDEEAFLRHNAQKAKEWRDKNKEHVSKWRTQNVTYRLRGIKQQAGKKGIPWGLTDEDCRKMMTSPCYYCGFITTETLNGMDRMDSSKGYSVTNCVSCCGT
jgi:hypothetical protein